MLITITHRIVIVKHLNVELCFLLSRSDSLVVAFSSGSDVDLKEFNLHMVSCIGRLTETKLEKDQMVHKFKHLCGWLDQ